MMQTKISRTQLLKNFARGVISTPEFAGFSYLMIYGSPVLIAVYTSLALVGWNPLSSQLATYSPWTIVAVNVLFIFSIPITAFLFDKRKTLQERQKNRVLEKEHEALKDDFTLLELAYRRLYRDKFSDQIVTTLRQVKETVAATHAYVYQDQVNGSDNVLSVVHSCDMDGVLHKAIHFEPAESISWVGKAYQQRGCCAYQFRDHSHLKSKWKMKPTVAKMFLNEIKLKSVVSMPLFSPTDPTGPLLGILTVDSTANSNLNCTGFDSSIDRMRIALSVFLDEMVRAENEELWDLVDRVAAS